MQRGMRLHGIPFFVEKRAAGASCVDVSGRVSYPLCQRSPERKIAAAPRDSGGDDMNGLLALSRGIDRINEIIAKSVAWLILLAVIVGAGNAIIRKVLNTSSNAWLELQWYLFGAAFMMAAAYTLKQNEHIRIDIVYGLFSRQVQHWIDLFGHVFFLMPFVILMIFYFQTYTAQSFFSGEMSSSAGGLILWPAKAVLLVGFVQLGFQGISEIIKKIAIMNGTMPDPTPFISQHEQAELEAKALAKELRS
jgi:TRAP-type mannitol/chloroaromatic compound transport system permease small subunit